MNGLNAAGEWTNTRMDSESPTVNDLTNSKRAIFQHSIQFIHSICVFVSGTKCLEVGAVAVPVHGFPA